MTTGKTYFLAFLLIGLSIVIAVSAGSWIAFQKTRQALENPDGTLARTVTAVSNLDGTLRDVSGKDGGEFGRRRESLRERFPFEQPDDGILTEHQMEQFLAVKRKVAEVEGEMSAARSLSPAAKASLATTWDAVSRLHRIRLVQIEALEQQRMPVEEYRWVYREISRAMVASGFEPAAAAAKESLQSSAGEAGLPAMSAEQKSAFGDLFDSIESGREILTGTGQGLHQNLAPVPPENRRMVERYRDDLDRYLFAGVDLDAVDVIAAMNAAKPF